MMRSGSCADAGKVRSAVVRRAMLPLATIVVAILALAGRADGFIYWATSPISPTFPHSIGRANLDGTGITPGFITGLSGPNDVAVDSAHVYWSTSIPTNSLARANLDGTGVNESFITGLDVPDGVAVDSAHVYWTEFTNRSIGRANLDGTGANTNFITGAPVAAASVAVDGAHVYWTTFTGNVIGRANLDGSGVNQNFITGADIATGIALDGAHVYWTNAGNGSIGRANLDGSGVDQTFIPGTANAHDGMAVDAAHIYWANSSTDKIGRANLDGTGVNSSFMTGVGQPVGLAVDQSFAGLVASVEQLGLPHGTERSLLTKLAGGPPCGSLAAFINALQAQSGKKIPATDAAELIAQASALRESLGCGGG
jgi:sugar lactone lactonase YvrE